MSREIAYGRLVCDDETTKKLNEFAKSLGLNEVSDEYHCTLLYSGDNVEKLLKKKLKLKFPLKAKIKAYHLFGDNKNCLVLGLENEKINQSWDQLMSAGANWDYPEFTPHLSLTYNYSDSNIPDNLPDFDIVFKGYKAEKSVSDFDPQTDAVKTLSESLKESASLSQLILFASKFNKSGKEVETFKVQIPQSLSFKDLVDSFQRALAIIHPDKVKDFQIKSVGSSGIECISKDKQRLYGELSPQNGLVTFYQ
jgi:hypothetical protein|nr:MAG TPA: RNA 2',3'-cyclic phosphodiesterase [Caudoviricetes sp.]